MNIIQEQVSNIKVYENNPRKNDQAVSAVAESIRSFGFKVPLVIDKENVIIAGHTRLKAAIRLGLEFVPCIVADDLTEEQVQAFRLADNKTGELAEWDFNALEAELFALQDIDMTSFGFEIEKISADDFGEDFSLPDGDTPSTRTITLSLSEEQYQIAMNCHDYIKDNVEELHSFGGKNEKSNRFFEVIYEWAQQRALL